MLVQRHESERSYIYVLVVSILRLSTILYLIFEIFRLWYFFFFHFIIGNALFHNNNMKFATKDQDNSGIDCPMYVHGAWWYKSSYCFYANLNGKYQPGVSNVSSVSWSDFRSHYYSLKRAQMMMRKK